MPSNDLLTRRHVIEGGVNVRALKRSAYSDSRQYLGGWRERVNLQTTYTKRGVNVSAFERRTYSEARQ